MRSPACLAKYSLTAEIIDSSSICLAYFKRYRATTRVDQGESHRARHDLCAVIHRITSSARSRHDDRDGGRGALDCLGCKRCFHDHHFDFLLDQVIDQRWYPIVIAVGVSPLDYLLHRAPLRSPRPVAPVGTPEPPCSAVRRSRGGLRCAAAMPFLWIGFHRQTEQPERSDQGVRSRVNARRVIRRSSNHLIRAKEQILRHRDSHFSRHAHVNDELVP